MGGLRRALAAATLIPVGGAAILGAEIYAAKRGPHLPDPPPGPVNVPAGPPGAPSPSGQAVPLVVWLGDSTAAGVGASDTRRALPMQVAVRLGRPVRLTVLARSGARVADVVHRQLPAMAGLKPDVVFISIGANDAIHLTWRSSFRRDYGRVLAGLPAGVGMVVMLGVPDMGAPPRLAQPLRAVAGWRGRALDADIRHLAARRHAIYVDIAGRTGPAFRDHPGRYFAADHYHPSDAGYALWADAVAATVAAATR